MKHQEPIPLATTLRNYVNALKTWVKCKKIKYTALILSSCTQKAILRADLHMGTTKFTSTPLPSYPNR